LSFRSRLARNVVSKTSSIVLKVVAVSVAVMVATYAVFYGFFITHQELGIEPSTAYRVATAAFLLSLVISWIYFRARAAR
jgi:membrane associated rhomboid family serine protease